MSVRVILNVILGILFIRKVFNVCGIGKKRKKDLILELFGIVFKPETMKSMKENIYKNTSMRDLGTLCYFLFKNRNKIDTRKLGILNSKLAKLLELKFCWKVSKKIRFYVF